MSIVVLSASAAKVAIFVPVRLKIAISSPADVPATVMMPPVGLGYAVRDALSMKSMPVYASTVTGKSIVLNP